MSHEDQIRAVSKVIRRQPVTLHGDATVQHACALMHGERIGAILIVDADSRLEGIFTGRDVVRLIAQGKSPAHTHLRDVMTRDPSHIPPGQHAIHALRLMQDGGFRHVPVVENGRVVGVVSHGDFRHREWDRLDEETGYWERL